MPTIQTDPRELDQFAAGLAAASSGSTIISFGFVEVMRNGTQDITSPSVSNTGMNMTLSMRNGAQGIGTPMRNGTQEIYAPPYSNPIQLR
jgi:hypothetical protein